MAVDKEVDRMLKLLREKIRDQGFTQLKVQQALGWGRTYISQLFRKQKSLRFDQILQILEVIEVDARDFFSEFYYLSNGEIGKLYPFSGTRPAVTQSWADEAVRAEGNQSVALGVARLLLDKGVITKEELDAVVAPWPAGSG